MFPSFLKGPWEVGTLCAAWPQEQGRGPPLLLPFASISLPVAAYLVTSVTVLLLL